MVKKEDTQMLNISQVSGMLGVHPNTLRRWTDGGLLPVYRMGPSRHRRYRKSDVEKLIRESRVQ